ncbi:endonuclease NucS domain-containing protein [Hyphomonas sp.]|uniref:endonuclease NucS domain-containing protein n=1 Tax=Hyphomonas sp. TaxID=87 RepID=UPI0032F041EC
MPIHHSLWTVSSEPSEVPASSMASEQELETMIAAAPQILSREWMLIGRQENTGFGGRVDLLALAPDGSLVLIELKRHRTPREVVAQAIDYASWVEQLEPDDIAAIYRRFLPAGNLAADFKDRFGQPLDEDTLNDSHQIVIVAADLDASTERIVHYLGQRDIAINVLFFQVFKHGEQRFLSRAWLLDPGQVQVSATSTSKGEKEPWNGEYYGSFGHGDERDWEEARRYGFFAAGGGAWYTNTMNLLDIGDRIWVRVPKLGYVGVGRVTGKPARASDFEIEGQPALSVLKSDYHRAFADDAEKSEYFVPIEWLQSVPLAEAVNDVGMFGNQNTVCAPKTPSWRTTVETLKSRFGIEK